MTENNEINAFSKKEEITKITEELKSHYYKNEFFVDPDKKFLNLIQKITNFFENDELILTIKQNENIKEKYKNALEYLKKVDQQKEFLDKKEKKLQLMQENLRLSKDENSFDENFNSPVKINRKNSKNSLEESLSEHSLSDMQDFPENKLTEENEIFFNEKIHENSNEKKNDKLEVENFLGQKNEIFEIKNFKAKKYYNSKKKDDLLEKLKDEYHNLISEKKNLEEKLIDFENLIESNKEIKSQNEALIIQNEILIEKNLNLNSENKCTLERNNKITKENYDLVNTIEQLKTSLNYLEKERQLKKNQINANFNKVKLYEKENNTSKKKLNNMNTNLKNLNNKLCESQQEKILLEKKMEDLKQDYENTITNLLLEQQKMQKDSFLSTLKSLEEKKIPLEFIYEEDKNSLVIQLEDIIIGEFPNFKVLKDTNNNNKNSPNLKSSFGSSTSKRAQIKINSPGKSSKNFDLNSVNSIGSKKNNAIDLETMLSLNKILSGSSKKSFSTKRILMSNFSSSKKNSQFFEEQFNSNNKICGPSDFSNINYQSNFFSVKNPLNFKNLSNKKNENFPLANNPQNNSQFKNERYAYNNNSCNKNNNSNKKILKTRKISIDENFDPNMDNKEIKVNKFYSISEKSEESKNQNFNKKLKQINLLEENLLNENDKEKENNNNRKNKLSTSSFNRKAINHKFESCIKNIDININTEQKNDFSKDDIKKFINSSTTNRHKRIISLDEALNFDEGYEKEIFQTERNSNPREKAIVFPHDIYNANTIPEKENKKFNFDVNFIDDLKTKGIFKEEKEKYLISNYDSEMQANFLKESLCEKMQNLIESNTNFNLLANKDIKFVESNVINLEISSEKNQKGKFAIEKNVNLISIEAEQNSNGNFVNLQKHKKSFASKDLEIANGFDFNIDEFNFSQILHKNSIKKYKIKYDFETGEHEKEKLNQDYEEFSYGKASLDLIDEQYESLISNSNKENSSNCSSKKKRRTAHYSKSHLDYQVKINKTLSKDKKKDIDKEEKGSCMRCSIL